MQEQRLERVGTEGSPLLHHLSHMKQEQMVLGHLYHMMQPSGHLFHMILFADEIRLKQAAGHKGVLDLHTLVLHVHTSDHALRPVDIVEAFVTGFLVAFAGHLMGNVVADDNVVLAERKAVVVVVDTCVVVDRAAGACKEAVPADKTIVVVVGKAVVGMVAADGSLVVDKDAAVCNVVVLVGSHLVVDKEVVDKGVVAVDTGEGMVVAGHTVKDLAGEALDERNAEDAVSGHSVHFVLGLEVWLVVLMPVIAQRLVLHGQPCRSSRYLNPKFVKMLKIYFKKLRKAPRAHVVRYLLSSDSC